MSDLTDRLLSASLSLPGEMIEIKNEFVHDNVCTEAANYILELELERDNLKNIHKVSDEWRSHWQRKYDALVEGLNNLAGLWSSRAPLLDSCANELRVLLEVDDE